MVFEVATLDDGSSPYADDLRGRGVRVHGLSAPAWSQVPLAAYRLRRLFGGVDVVHANLVHASAVSEVARRMGRRPPPSVVVRHHNRNHHLQGKTIHVRIDRWTARSASLVVGVSDAVRDTLVAIEGVDPGRVRVVYNGLPWDRVVGDDAGAGRWRARFGGGPLLVAAGRIDFQKDYPTLLTAVAEVRRHRPDVVLAVAHQNAPTSAMGVLDQLVEALGLSGAVVFLGMVDDVYDLMTAADVFVQASVDESFGQTLLEAMALGVPLVTTTPGGAGDVVRDWYPSRPAGDATGLASAILAVLDDLPSARSRAAGIAADVRERFGAREMAAGMVNVYRSLLR